MAEVTVAEGVVTPGDGPAAVEAVVAAARRFCWINEHGAEVADDDPDRGGYCTPSYVAAFHSAAGQELGRARRPGAHRRDAARSAPG